jgi:hypothetical protein
MNAAAVSALFLLALSGGFLFMHWCHRFRFAASRQEGQRLLFLSVCWAVPLLAWSCLFLWAANGVLSGPRREQIGAWWSDVLGPLATSGTVIFVVAFVSGPAFALLVNLFYRKGRASRYALSRFGSELEQFLYESMNEALLVSVTLENRKVYVGWPTSTGVPLLRERKPEEKDQLSLLPALSGYRDEITHKVKFTTQYWEVYEKVSDPNWELAGQLGAGDFEVVIPWEAIVSAQRYSPELEQGMFEMTPEQPEQTRNTGLLHTLLTLLTVWRITREPPRG